MRVDYWISEVSVYCADCKPEGAEPVFGSEADVPQHCAQCSELLNGTLTDDGRAYVLDAIIERFATGRGSVLVLESWIDAYDVTLSDLFRRQLECAVEAGRSTLRTSEPIAAGSEVPSL